MSASRCRLEGPAVPVSCACASKAPKAFGSCAAHDRGGTIDAAVVAVWIRCASHGCTGFSTSCKKALIVGALPPVDVARDGISIGEAAACHR